MPGWTAAAATATTGPGPQRLLLLLGVSALLWSQGPPVPSRLLRRPNQHHRRAQVGGFSWPSILYEGPSFVSLQKQRRPPSSQSPPTAQMGMGAETQRERRLQACVREGGFYDGEWVYAPNASRPHAHYRRMNHHAFLQAEMAFRQEFPAEQGWDRYYLPWNQFDFESTDADCRLSPFNRTRACLALGRAAGASRRLLVVGDSMSFATAASLVLMLGGPPPPTNQTAWREQPVCEDVLPEGDGPVLVHFIRNDALYTSAAPLEWWATEPQIARVAHAGVDFRSSRPWTPYYEEKQPGLVIFNLGTHIHGLEFFQVLLDDALAYLRLQREQRRRAQEGTREPRLLFRLTSPGHPNCWEYSGPVPRDVTFAYEGKYRDGYTWHLIADYNAYLEEAVRAAFPEAGQDDSVLLLRTEGMSRHRPDGHLQGKLQDCLHYHLPGVPDTWTLAFLDTLYVLHGL